MIGRLPPHPDVLHDVLGFGCAAQHSVDDAVELSKNLGNPYHIISIEAAFNAFETTLSPLFGGSSGGVTEENMQSRSRAVILMALSNKNGSILLNTSNKSENAVGYGTLYGDMCGGLSVIGDLYKTGVAEGKMPHPVIVAIVIVKQLPPLLPG